MNREKDASRRVDAYERQASDQEYGGMAAIRRKRLIRRAFLILTVLGVIGLIIEFLGR